MLNHTDIATRTRIYRQHRRIHLRGIRNNRAERFGPYNPAAVKDAQRMLVELRRYLREGV